MQADGLCWEDIYIKENKNFLLLMTYFIANRYIQLKHWDELPCNNKCKQRIDDFSNLSFPAY